MPTTHEEKLDAQHWDAVEEASELIQEGRYQDALYLLRDVAQADPKNPYAYFFMGVAMFEVGQLEASRDAYRAALRLSPYYVGARGSLAQVLRLLGDLKGAVTEGLTTLRLKQDDPDALHAVGLAYAQLDQKTPALRYLRAFLETKPEIETAQEVRQVIAELEGPDNDSN
jgi:tetratricopeptide (TPR) repeat protein